MCAVGVAVLYVVYYLCHHIYYKMLHTFGELSDMHFYYDATDGNSTKAQRLYGKKYETMPSAKIFHKIDQRLQGSGMLRPDGRIQRDNVEGRMLHHIQENARLSTMIIAAEEGISNSNV